MKNIIAAFFMFTIPVFAQDYSIDASGFFKNEDGCVAKVNCFAFTDDAGAVNDCGFDLSIDGKSVAYMGVTGEINSFENDEIVAVDSGWRTGYGLPVYENMTARITVNQYARKPNTWAERLVANFDIVVYRFGVETARCENLDHTRMRDIYRL